MFDCRLLTRFRLVMQTSVFALALPLVHCFAEDLPQLGQPELIGSLISAETPVEPELGTPILLAALEISFDNESLLQPDPEGISLHLRRSSALLKAAGLMDKAEAIESVLHDFEAVDRGRLVLQMKRAELARLQLEIEQLSRQFEVTSGAEAELLPVDFQVPSQVLED